MNQLSYSTLYQSLFFPQIEDGCYRAEIFQSIVERLDQMIINHNKVLVIRFDVHFPVGYVHEGHNTELSFFIRRLRENIEYSRGEVHYVWAREQANSPVPHYHVILMLDGSKTQNPMGILHEADRIWTNRIGYTGTGLVHFCQQDGGVGHVMIRRPSNLAVGEDLLAQQRQAANAYHTALAKGSYLAKTYSKGDAPFRAREYGCSQMRGPK